MRVIQTIQSPGNDPVKVPQGPATDSKFEVLAQVTAALALDFADVPEAYRPKTIDIRIEF